MLKNIKDSFFQYRNYVGKQPDLLFVPLKIYEELLRTNSDGKYGFGQPLIANEPMTFFGKEVILCEKLSTEFEWFHKELLDIFLNRDLISDCQQLVIEEIALPAIGVNTGHEKNLHAKGRKIINIPTAVIDTYRKH